MNRQFVDFAIDATGEAGQIALSYFQSENLKTERKKDRSLLSEADLATEKHIVDRISASWPDHPIIGEESAAKYDEQYFSDALAAANSWVIDPIDGTNNFVAGLPSWCVAVAHLEYGRPTLGVVYFPAMNDELYYNDNGTIVLRRGEHKQPIAFPGDGSSRIFMAHDSFYARFLFEYPHIPRITGCTVLNLLYTMLGKAFAAITSAHIWDFAAPLAYASSREIAMADIHSGATISQFTPQQFYLDPNKPRRLWRIRGEHIVAHRSLIEEVRKAVCPC